MRAFVRFSPDFLDIDEDRVGAHLACSHWSGFEAYELHSKSLGCQ
jgi:hypothetical protein